MVINTWAYNWQPASRSASARKVGGVVLDIEETGVPVVDALHDMQRHFGEVDAGRRGINEP